MPAATYRRSIAAHEAAHAVIGRLLGLSVRRVSLLPGPHPEAAGWCRLGVPFEVDLADASDAEGVGLGVAVLTALTAGFLAQQRVDPRADPATAREDRRQAMEMARQLSRGEEPEALLAWCLARARALLTDAGVWAQVEAVAERLLERQVLSGEQIRRTMRRTRRGAKT